MRLLKNTLRSTLTSFNSGVKLSQKKYTNTKCLDIPTFIYNNNIIFIGLSIDLEVLKLLICQVLYQNYKSKNKTLSIFINSPSLDNNLLNYDYSHNYFECLKAIKIQYSTLNLGNVGSGLSLILASGERNKRFMCHNARIIINPLIKNGESVSAKTKLVNSWKEISIKQKEFLDSFSTQTYLNQVQIEQIYKRKICLNAEESKKFGIIDKLVLS